MKSRVLRWLLLTVLACAALGCGQKGDLYLPDQAPAQEQEDDDEDG